MKTYIGITKDGELYAIEVRHDRYFSICGETVRPITSRDAKRQTIESLSDLLSEPDELRAFNERNNSHCRTGSGATKIVLDIDGWETHFDNSLEREEIQKGNTIWLFESSCCGQHDSPLIEGLAVSFYPTSVESLILEYWKAYHLKPAEDMYQNLIKALQPIYDVEYAFNKMGKHSNR
jgi:hypothetical protein